ncbi:MAG: VOC family protein [Chromatiales bacterium]|jgi:glyoxylase I family protein|nr:VOC family protein [Chromatiales bacterium]
MIIQALHHVSVIVSDTAHSLAFYCDLLGMTQTDRPDLGFPGAWLQIGAQQLHLMQVPPPHGAALVDESIAIGRDRHVAFHVDDVDAFADRLRQAGIAFSPSRSGRRVIFCRDPDGNGIELAERPRF